MCACLCACVCGCVCVTILYVCVSLSVCVCVCVCSYSSETDICDMKPHEHKQYSFFTVCQTIISLDLFSHPTESFVASLPGQVWRLSLARCHREGEQGVCGGAHEGPQPGPTAVQQEGVQHAATGLSPWQRSVSVDLSPCCGLPVFAKETGAWVGLFSLQPDFRIRDISESNKNGFEMHFQCDFSPFRVQTLTWSHPCYTVTG